MKSLYLSFTLQIATACLAQDFRRGDANADGKGDPTDIMFTLYYLYNGGPEPSCKDAADMDNDGVISITDAIRIIYWINLCEGQHILPGPLLCGPDPFNPPDNLDCFSYPANNCHPLFEQMPFDKFRSDYHDTRAQGCSGFWTNLGNQIIKQYFTAILRVLLDSMLSPAARDIALNDFLMLLDGSCIKYKLVKIDSDPNILGFMESVIPGDKDYKGWGAVLVRTNATGHIVYQAPHPIYDGFTDTIALDAFMADPDAAVLMLAGTHRFASCPATLPEDCDKRDPEDPGTGCSTHNNGLEPQVDSDVTHATKEDNLFQVLTRHLADEHGNSGPDYTFVQIHGSMNRDDIPSDPTITASDGVPCSNNTNAADCADATMACMPTPPPSIPLINISTKVRAGQHISIGVCGHYEGGTIVDENSNTVCLDGNYNLCANNNVQLRQAIEPAFMDRLHFMHFEIETTARGEYEMGRKTPNATNGYLGVLDLLEAIRIFTQ